MSFDLHLELSGLCALVPHEPITILPAPPAPPVPQPLPLPLTLSSLRILLPDVRIESRVGPHRICAHHPLLRVEQPDGTMQELAMLGDDIRILTVDNSQSGVELRPTFSLVADMVRVKPDFQVDSRLFTTPIGRNDIVTRLEVTAAKAFGIKPSQQILSFPTAPLYTGNFAQAVRLEIRIAGEAGSFQLTSLQDGTVRTLPFGSKPDGTPVRAELRNLCNEADLIPEEDADFAAFYLLERGLRKPFLVPEPLVNPGEILGGATNGFTCVPATTNHF